MFGKLSLERAPGGGRGHCKTTVINGSGEEAAFAYTQHDITGHRPALWTRNQALQGLTRQQAVLSSSPPGATDHRTADHPPKVVSAGRGDEGVYRS